MKLGIDIHGVLDKHPEIIKPLMEMFIKSGNTVYIISGSPINKIFKELKELRCIALKHFHYAISIIDFLKSKGVKFRVDGGGNWWCDEDTWWESKARICNELKIDVLIDDSKKYKPHFENLQTKFILLG